MNKGDDPYVILGVPYDASESQIKKAYFKLARQYHPDKQTTEEDKARNGSVFAKISDAYDLSKDPVRRYDWKMANEANLKVKAKPSRPTSHTPQSRPALRRTQTVPNKPGPQRPGLNRQNSMPRPSNRRPASKRQPPRPASSRQIQALRTHEGVRSPQRPGPNRTNSTPTLSPPPQRPCSNRQNSMPRPLQSKPRQAFNRQQSKPSPQTPQTPQIPVPKRQNSTPRQPPRPAVSSPSVRGDRPKEPERKRSILWHREQANRPREPNPQQAPTQLHEENPFDVLGIHYTADRVEIIHAYRLLAQKYQPAKQPTEESRGDATQKMAQIHKAYNILKDSAMKHEWQLKSRGSGGGDEGGRRRKVLKPAYTSKKSFMKKLAGKSGKGEKKRDKKGKAGKKSKASKNIESENSFGTAKTHEITQADNSQYCNPDIE